MYRVAWEDTARADVLTVLTQVGDLPSVTRAVAAIEDQLVADPLSGRHLSEGLWRLVVPPVAVFYAIDLSARSVTIIQVAAAV